MASPGELVKVIALAVDMPEAAVTNIDRQLAIAGLRSKGGRGISAARVTPRDAASLLTAILAGGPSKEAATSVRRYQETRAHLGAAEPAPYDGLGFIELQTLPVAHSFIDALAALIEASGPHGARRSDGSLPSMLEISALSPGTLGEIRIAGCADGRVRNVRYLRPDPWIAAKGEPPDDRAITEWETQCLKTRAKGDLQQFRRISETTIRRVAELLGT